MSGGRPGAAPHPGKERQVSSDPHLLSAGLLSAGQFGFDRESMRVLMPREMIELYVVDADHIDFKL